MTREFSEVVEDLGTRYVGGCAYRVSCIIAMNCWKSVEGVSVYWCGVIGCEECFSQVVRVTLNSDILHFTPSVTSKFKEHGKDSHRESQKHSQVSSVPISRHRS